MAEFGERLDAVLETILSVKGDLYTSQVSVLAKLVLFTKDHLHILAHFAKQDQDLMPILLSEGERSMDLVTQVFGVITHGASEEDRKAALKDLNAVIATIDEELKHQERI